MAEMRTLQLLLEQAQRARDEALLALQRAEQRARQARAQARDLGDYQTQYDARWLASFRSKGAPVTLVQAHHAFGARLSEAIGQQAQAAALADSRLQAARLAVQEREMKVATLGKLIERRQAEATLSAHRSEQKMLDEFGALAVQRRR